MAVNMAQKRARKAQRRKQMVAEKRRGEQLDATLPARVLRAAQAPIQACLLTETLFEGGMGTLVLARGASPHYVAMAAFLLDVFCLGIKDVTFWPAEGEVFDMYVDAMNAASPIVPVDPGRARRLMRDLAAWSQSIGFPPHRDFAAVERIFGDIVVDAAGPAFPFGRDGKPFYIPGPGESDPLIRQRIARLRQSVGDDGFDFETAA